MWKQITGRHEKEEYMHHINNRSELILWNWRLNVCFVQFHSWFRFNFPSIQTHYHTCTLPYPKTKENKISTNDKIELHHKTEITACFAIVIEQKWFWSLSGLKRLIRQFWGKEKSTLNYSKSHEMLRVPSNSIGIVGQPYGLFLLDLSCIIAK